MREIKFRAWDKYAKKMIFDFVISQYNKFSGWSNCVYCGLKVGSGGSDDYVLMQYTGLKDKNGKEICEGDIIEDHYWNSLWFTKKITVGIPDIYTWLGGHKSEKGSYYKVIGNIYENPELLKGGGP